MVSSKALEKFKKLYKAKFNVDLTEEEAMEMAADLVNLIKLLMEPLPIQSQKPFQPEEMKHETI